MKRKVILGILVVYCVAQTATTVTVCARSHRQKKNRGDIWQQGYTNGVKRALDASQEQFRLITTARTIDQVGMTRFVQAGLTNNPYAR